MSLRRRSDARAVPGSGGETLERLLDPPGRRRTLADIAVAIAGPGLVTALASIPSYRGTAVPALLYLLAVVAAAAVGRLWPALLAAAGSFTGLDYFFTPPVHTFTVAKGEDLFALGVFLVVAVVVSGAISSALEQRAAAQFRERQMRALYQVTARLLSGVSLDVVLRDLAGSLRVLFDLRGCRVVVIDPEDGSESQRAASGVMGGSSDTTAVPLVAEGRPVGRIEMAGPPGGIGSSEAEVLETLAGQLALALERARLGDEAERARVAAEASRSRAALFSSVTHDLRTPLASITASASSLLEEGVPFSPEQQEELLRTILEESQRLNRLVGNLMDVSRLRAGALTPTVQAVPLEDLVSSVIQRMGPVLAGRPVRVLMREDIPPVPMDVVQMDQVLTNLLENAARYSPPGSRIAVTAARWHDMVEVRVCDHGPGIPREQRPAVFQEFYREDVDGRRGGTGLGLAIASAVVAAHRGSMWIEDTPGGGATVGFRLPLEETARRDVR